MGIDVYLSWHGMTREQREAQYTGMSVKAGVVGYLREAYHGGPYATKVLVPEGWEDHEEGALDGGGERDVDDAPTFYGVPIPAATLHERLPRTLEVAAERERVVYKEAQPDPAILQSYRDFVALAERMEAETGQPCRIHVSW